MDLTYLGFIAQEERQNDKVIERICDTAKVFQKDPDFCKSLNVKDSAILTIS